MGNQLVADARRIAPGRFGEDRFQGMRGTLRKRPYLGMAWDQWTANFTSSV